MVLPELNANALKFSNMIFQYFCNIGKLEKLTIKLLLCNGHHIRVMEMIVDMGIVVIQKWSRFPALYFSTFPYGLSNIFKIALPTFKTSLIFTWWLMLNSVLIS